jgi:N-acetylglutamate synthase-like GNAT family acetyltransferase
MPPDVVIAPYASQAADQIFQLILPIQTEEFGIPITRRDQPDLDAIPAYYQQGLGNFWVASWGADVIGTIALKDIGNHQVALRKMFVHANHRGAARGVSLRLLQTAIAWCTQHLVTDIFLGTTGQFHAAHRFYEKNGFAEIDREHLPATFSIMRVDTKFYWRRLAPT